ncbi:MAG: hypothetical protein U0704_03590 [Candidatus Eisenbacteria bacterium]
MALARMDAREHLKSVLYGLPLGDAYGVELGELAVRYLGKRKRIEWRLEFWAPIVLCVFAILGLVLQNEFAWKWVLVAGAEEFRKAQLHGYEPACAAVFCLLVFLLFRLPKSRSEGTLPIKPRMLRWVARLYRNGLEGYLQRFVAEGDAGVFVSSVAHHIHDRLIADMHRRAARDQADKAAAAKAEAEKIERELHQHLSRRSSLGPNKLSTHDLILKYMKSEGVVKTREQIESFLSTRKVRVETRQPYAARAISTDRDKAWTIVIDGRGVRCWNRPVSYGSCDPVLAECPEETQFELANENGRAVRPRQVLVLRKCKGGRRYLVPAETATAATN